VPLQVHDERPCRHIPTRDLRPCDPSITYQQTRSYYAREDSRRLHARSGNSASQRVRNADGPAAEVLGGLKFIAWPVVPARGPLVRCCERTSIGHATAPLRSLMKPRLLIFRHLNVGEEVRAPISVLFVFGCSVNAGPKPRAAQVKSRGARNLFTAAGRRHRCGQGHGNEVPTFDVSRRSKLSVQKLNLFDHLIGASEQRRMQIESYACAVFRLFICRSIV
jgi:hypothetical protein